MLSEYYDFVFNEIVRPYVGQCIEAALAQHKQVTVPSCATPLFVEQAQQLCRLFDGLFDGSTLYLHTLGDLRQAQIICGCNRELIRLTLQLY